MVKIRFTLAAAALAAFLLSTATAQPPGGGRGQGGGMMGMMRGGATALLTHPDVQTELKLTDAQKEKLKEFATAQQEKMREMFAGGRDNIDREKIQEMVKELGDKSEKLVKETLKPEQITRLNQIKWQQAGVAAYVDKEVQEKLKFNDEQKEKLKGISEEMTADMRELMQNRGNREEMREKTEALRKEATEKANKVLTDEQKKTHKEMLGEKFDLKMENFPRGEGRPGGGDRGKGGKGGDAKKDGEAKKDEKKAPPKRGDG